MHILNLIGLKGQEKRSRFVKLRKSVQKLKNEFFFSKISSFVLARLFINLLPQKQVFKLTF